jgi:hypothetical protein
MLHADVLHASYELGRCRAKPATDAGAETMPNCAIRFTAYVMFKYSCLPDPGTCTTASYYCAAGIMARRAPTTALVCLLAALSVGHAAMAAHLGEPLGSCQRSLSPGVHTHVRAWCYQQAAVGCINRFCKCA